MIAVSKTEEKETIIKIIVNLINKKITQGKIGKTVKE